MPHTARTALNRTYTSINTQSPLKGKEANVKEGEGGLVQVDPKLEATKHWRYTEGLIRIIAPTTGEDTISAYKYLYEQGIIHGWKHGMEEKSNG